MLIVERQRPELLPLDLQDELHLQSLQSLQSDRVAIIYHMFVVYLSYVYRK